MGGGEVRGNLPAPIGGLLCKHKRWSRVALERAINGEIDTVLPTAAADPLMQEIRRRAARAS